MRRKRRRGRQAHVFYQLCFEKIIIGVIDDIGGWRLTLLSNLRENSRKRVWQLLTSFRKTAEKKCSNS